MKEIFGLKIYPTLKFSRKISHRIRHNNGKFSANPASINKATINQSPRRSNFEIVFVSELNDSIRSTGEKISSNV